MNINEVTIDQLKSDPILGFEGDTLKSYLEQNAVSVGDEMMIYGSHGMMHHYTKVVVEAVNSGRQNRIVVSKSGYSGGKSFYRTGKNCFAPTGQSKLIPLIPYIEGQMGQREEVSFSWDWKQKI
ncbi:hypothetical protein [Vibrio anguillarum]|uniref:hypothetical protein n=1 Tax=Vibrio anguillarum TaxID=55601 RepID=UPI002FE46764